VHLPSIRASPLSKQLFKEEGFKEGFRSSCFKLEENSASTSTTSTTTSRRSLVTL
jgi:hypothetical protein